MTTFIVKFLRNERKFILLGVYSNTLNIKKNCVHESHQVLYIYIILTVPRLQSLGVISQVFPLHNQNSLQELRAGWVQGFFKKQPLGKSFDLLTPTYCFSFIQNNGWKSTL